MLWPMPDHAPQTPATVRRVRLFRNGRNQALRIPRELELDADEATIRRDGDRLFVEPVAPRRLLDLLATWQPLDEVWPDIDEGLVPLDDPSL
jgi:antitoxin VapB